jgi:hypothetical protein
VSLLGDERWADVNASTVARLAPGAAPADRVGVFVRLGHLFGASESR